VLLIKTVLLIETVLLTQKVATVVSSVLQYASFLLH